MDINYLSNMAGPGLASRSWAEDVLLREGWARNETISLVAIMGPASNPKAQKERNRPTVNDKYHMNIYTVYIT